MLDEPQDQKQKSLKQILEERDSSFSDPNVGNFLIDDQEVTAHNAETMNQQDSYRIFVNQQKDYEDLKL